eukprot:SAG25_NODE_266_length_10666_cov_14.508943_2_plen_119_part_00
MLQSAVRTHLALAQFSAMIMLQEPTSSPAVSLSPRSARGEEEEVSQNGYLLSHRGCSLPANASGFDTHRDSISSRFDCRRRRVGQPRTRAAAPGRPTTTTTTTRPSCWRRGRAWVVVA